MGIPQRSRSVAGSTPARSVRISNEVWQSAKRRAAREGTTVSNVVGVLLEGYARGLQDLPQTRTVYKKPREVAEPSEQTG